MNVIPLGRRPKTPADATTKVCITCGKTKPIDDFYRLHRGSEARQSRCRGCDNEVRARGVRAVFELAGAAAPRVLKAPVVDHFAEKDEDNAEDAPWDRERLARARVWHRYDLDIRELEAVDGKPPKEPPAAPRAHLVDDAAIARWSNHVVAELRAGAPMRVAIATANAAEDLDGEVRPLNLFGDRDQVHALARVELATPPERQIAPPKSVEPLIPREGRVRDLLDDDGPLDADETPFDHAPRPAATSDAVPETSPRTLPPRRPASSSGAASGAGARNTEGKAMSMPMKPETVALREKIVAALKLQGPTAPRDLVASIGVDNAVVRHAFKTLLSDGTCEVTGWTRALRWQMKGEKRSADESRPAAPKKAFADVAKKAAAKEKKPRAKKPARRARACVARAHRGADRARRPGRPAARGLRSEDGRAQGAGAMTARVAPPPVAARLRALDDAMFAVQREYISESAGLSANELRQIEAKADERMRSLRSRRSALVRELRKQGLLP